MKNLELKERKNTTNGAKKAVMEFIESFDFSAYSDIADIMSKPFSLVFDTTGKGLLHNMAYFELSKCGFTVSSYDYENGSSIYDKQWTNISSVFDSTCTFINFKELVDSMVNFIAKINKATAEKEAEIANFLDFCEGWKSYQNTIKNADEMDNSTVIL